WPIANQGDLFELASQYEHALLTVPSSTANQPHLAPFIAKHSSARHVAVMLRSPVCRPRRCRLPPIIWRRKKWITTSLPPANRARSLHAASFFWRASPRSALPRYLPAPTARRRLAVPRSPPPTRPPRTRPVSPISSRR